MSEDDYQEEEDRLPQRNVLVESGYEYGKWLNDPAAVHRFKEITKDIPMSNLTPEQEFFVTEAIDIMLQCESLGKPRSLKKAVRFFEGQIHAKCNASLGRGGFARTQDRTQIVKQDITKDERKKRSWNPLSKRR